MKLFISSCSIGFGLFEAKAVSITMVWHLKAYDLAGFQLLQVCIFTIYLTSCKLIWIKASAKLNVMVKRIVVKNTLKKKKKCILY